MASVVAFLAYVLPARPPVLSKYTMNQLSNIDPALLSPSELMAQVANHGNLLTTDGNLMEGERRTSSATDAVVRT